MVSDTLILPWLERLREEVSGLELFDTHTHIGENDPDGFRCTRDELVAALELADARAVVFAMHEPEGYPPANDRVMRVAAESDGRLVAFSRVDPRAEPVREAERCLDAGARGIKLHPRAEEFTLDIPPVRDLFALAHERAVPVLCHAGRGIPALGTDALHLCESFPDVHLILAHAGISDLAWIWRDAADHPNLFFDTSWWSPSDLLTLFTLVPPGSILLGSDAPYGTPALGATMAGRYALQAGLSHDQVRGVLGGQLEKLIAGDVPLDLGPAPGPGSLPTDPLLDRLYAFLMNAIGQMVAGIDPTEYLALARLACEVGDDAPQTPVCRSVLALIEERERYVSDGTDRPRRFAPGIHLIVVAAGIARTPDVALPHEPVPVDVAERAPS